MNILFLGDIVGKSGRRAVKEQLPALRQKYKADLVIANSENAAHGKGITAKIFHELLSYGIDVMTMGNHAYSQSNLTEIIEDPRLVFPANYLQDKAKGITSLEVLGQKVCIINLLGKVFMDREVKEPAAVLDELLEDKEAIYILDLHAEATSEKRYFLFAYKDRLTAIIGTHTHVQTADEQIMDGCAYITDAGMCGTYRSILGRDPDEILRLFKGEKTHYTIAEGPYILSGVFLSIRNKRAERIERISILEEKMPESDI